MLIQVVLEIILNEDHDHDVHDVLVNDVDILMNDVNEKIFYGKILLKIFIISLFL